MNLIKTTFTIGELESLTGIKAHTIRIWEKRYTILEPLRKETNSRLYTNTDLQKLLNISILIQNGYKISKIATFSVDEIDLLVTNLKISATNSDAILHQFRIAMTTYNETAFINVYKHLRQTKSVRQIFQEFLLKLLEDTGVLWQANQILPSHEHFISNVIRMIFIAETFQINEPTNQKKVFVLFTPLHEIHELALLFLQHEIKQKGYLCIYLGTHVPLNTLQSVQKQYKNLIYLTYTTIQPTNINDFITDLSTEIDLENNKIWIAGRKVDTALKPKNSQISLFNSIENILIELDQMTYEPS